MAGAFRIAEGYVEVTAEEGGYDRAMERLKSTRHEVKVGVRLDQAGALAGLKELTRNQALRVNVDLSSLAATTGLRKFLTDRTLRVFADLDTRTAADDLKLLTRDRVAKVRIDLDQTALATLDGRSYIADIVAQINDVAYERVRKQLDKLTADRVVQIRASVDTRVGAQEIRNLTQRQRVRIGVDVDTRVAADDLAALTRARTARVTATADTGAAAARLDVLARDRRATINVDVRGGALSSLTSLGSAAGSSSGGLGILSSSVAKIAATILAALPTLASLGESLVQMGPAAALAVPAVLSLATAFAAVKIGTSGVSDAFKAAFAPATASARSAATAVRQVENAQRSLARAVQAEKDAEVNAAAARVKAARDVADAQLNLKNTVQDVADANHRAAEQVASAERDLTQAQQAAKQAQQDLTQARKDAAQQLEDLSNQLTDSQLSQRQDALALADAEQNLAAVKAKGAAATQEEIDKAQLAYDQAAQALNEQTTQTQRLQDQTDQANKAGVEGSSQVTAAKQSIADANQSIGDKTQSLADTQHAADEAATDGAQKTAKARRDLADAQAAATKAAVDGARQIADANQAVADAARSLAEAQASSAGAVDKTAAAMARLAPNARAFVQAVIGLQPAWATLRLDVQNRLFQGLGASFTTMAHASLPALRTGLSGTAGVLNAMARNALSAVTNLAKTGTLKTLFSGLNGSLAPLSRIPGQFITALVQLSVAAAPAFTRLTTAIGGAADSISKKLGGAFKSGALTDSINTAVGIAKQFGRLIADIAGTIGNVFKAASAGGGDALGLLSNLFATLRRVTGSPEVQKALTSIFTAINKIATLVAGTLGQALGQLVIGLAPVADAITSVLSGLGDSGPLISGLIAAFNPFLGILTLIAPIIGDLAQPIVGLVKAVAPILGTLSQFASGLFTALTPVLGALIDVLSAVLTAIAPVFARVAPILLQVVTAIAGPLTQVIQSLIPMVGPLVNIMLAFDLALLPLLPSILQLLPPLAQLAIALAGLAVNILTPLLPLVTGLASLLTDVLGAAISILLPVISGLVAALTGLVDATSAAVKAIAAAFQWLWTKAKEIFSGLGRDISRAWSALWSGVRNTWNGFWSGLQSAFSGAWSWATRSLTSFARTITGTWSTLWTGVRDSFTTLIGTVTSRIGTFITNTKKAFGAFRDSLGTIWNGVKEKFAGPVRFLINTVYADGVEKMWNMIAGKISSKIKLPDIPLGFSTGGVVPGTGTRDSVPAMLTPNERVLSLGQVAKLGGHRGIDAMLGLDRPTGTGGNPTSAQEARTRQPVPRFGIGGIVGSVTDTVTGAVSGGVDWAKGLVVGGLQAAARKAIRALVDPLINRIPGGGFADLLKGLAKGALSNMLGFLGQQDKDAAGGPGVQRGLAWARTQEGKPYQWGGDNNPSFDCSGLQSAIESVIRGESPHRRWATGAFSGSTAPPGWVRNLISPFMIGVTNRGSGHTAGTIAGVNVESRGGDGIVIGPHARGYNDRLFGARYGFEPATKFDNGGLLHPGATMAVNKTGRPERVLTADQTARVDALLDSVSHVAAGDVIVNMNISSLTLPPAAERKRWAQEMADDISEAVRRRDRSLVRGGKRS